MIKVIVCDDHALIRRGIRDTLADAADIDVVGGSLTELRLLDADLDGVAVKRTVERHAKTLAIVGLFF